MRAVPDFRGELHARRAGADDHDVDCGGFTARGAAFGPDARSNKAPVEPLGIRRRVERDRVLGNARNAEIVADAADAEDERVIRQSSRGKNLPAVVVEDRGQMHFVARAVEPGDRPEPEPEVVPIGDQEVVDAVQIGIHAPRRDLVQQRLPQMSLKAVDERNDRAPAPTQRVTEPCRERQSGGAAADDDDPMRD